MHPEEIEEILINKIRKVGNNCLKCKSKCARKIPINHLKAVFQTVIEQNKKH